MAPLVAPVKRRALQRIASAPAAPGSSLAEVVVLVARVAAPLASIIAGAVNVALRLTLACFFVRLVGLVGQRRRVLVGRSGG